MEFLFICKKKMLFKFDSYEQQVQSSKILRFKNFTILQFYNYNFINFFLYNWGKRGKRFYLPGPSVAIA